MARILRNIHGHMLSKVYDRDGVKCDICDGPNPYGIHCDICKFTIHARCSFVFYLEKTMEHHYHIGHPLELLTTGAPDHTDPNCHICGRNTKRILYRCTTCEVNLDIDCMLATMCTQAQSKMPWHHHPLLILDFNHQIDCDACGRLSWERGYFCPRCRLAVHKGCASVFDSPEITHPSHVRHPLKSLRK